MNRDIDPFTDWPPEEAKEFFLELIQELIDLDLPYELKKMELRSSAIDFDVPLNEKEIEDLLAPNEKIRKEKWEATLKRFGKK